VNRLSMIMTVATLGLAGAFPAGAEEPDVAPFEVVGQAPQVCALGRPALTSGQNLNFRSLNGSLLTIDTLTEGATLATRPAHVTVGFDAVCNYPHRVVLESENNGLWRASAFSGLTPDGFADGVPYTATLEWGLSNGRLEADATSRDRQDLSVAVDQATAGGLAIQLNIEPGASNLRRGSPLLAGTYQDTLRITVEPQ
jgi:hypothetical protein